MLKIGDFSKLAQVTIKTLHFYDKVNLLKPAHVDHFTGYRFYSVDQLPRLNRIVALKELGFSLEQIARLLEDAVSVDQMKGMLLLKQGEIERQMQEEIERLERIKARLNQIEQEGELPVYEVTLKPIEAFAASSLRAIIADYGESGALFGEIFACIHQQNIAPVGPPLVIYHDCEYKETDPDVEALIPVARAGTPAGRVQFVTLNAVMMATVIHSGGYDTLSSAYTALLHWTEANGYQWDGPNREVYLRGPGAKITPDQYVTEIQMPIIKATS